MLVALALLTVLLVGLFVLPAGDGLAHADAVVVLGDDGLRIEKGEQLVADGWADVMVLSTRTPDNCEPDVPVAAQYCFAPRPNSTRGEARALADLVRQHGWRTLLVVTQNEQARRARLRVLRCLPDGVVVRMVTVRRPAVASAWAALYESGALLKAVVWQRTC